MNLWFVAMAVHHPVMTSFELGAPGSVIVHCNTVGRTATKHQSEFQNRILFHSLGGVGRGISHAATPSPWEYLCGKKTAPCTVVACVSSPFLGTLKFARCNCVQLKK